MRYKIGQNKCANTTVTLPNKISFKVIDTGKIERLSAIKKLSMCQLDDIYNNLSRKVAPDFIQSTGNDFLYKKGNSLIDTLKFPFVDMPKELLSLIAKKFNIRNQICIRI